MMENESRVVHGSASFTGTNIKATREVACVLILPAGPSTYHHHHHIITKFRTLLSSIQYSTKQVTNEA
jgi:hypothetical protein